MKKLLLLLPLLFVYMGCREYQGDGTYKKYPLFSNDCQYEVDFGQIDLSAAGDHIYHFTGIPSSEYWLCLRLSFLASSPAQAEEFWKMRTQLAEAKAEIALSIADERGRAVITSKGVLSGPTWHWSEAQIGNFPFRGGGTALHEFNVFPKAPNKDVFFRLRARSQYTLRLTVLEAVKGSKAETKLLLQGGFWK